MTSKRKMQRKKEKEAQQEVKETLGLFDKIPEECLTCRESFDKKDKKMVSEWRVVVRKQEKKVRLYCPKCWDAAIKIVKDYGEQSE